MPGTNARHCPASGWLLPEADIEYEAEIEARNPGGKAIGFRLHDLPRPRCGRGGRRLRAGGLPDRRPRVAPRGSGTKGACAYAFVRDPDGNRVSSAKASLGVGLSFRLGRFGRTSIAWQVSACAGIRNSGGETLAAGTLLG